MYSSTFPSSPATDAYLRAGRIIEPAETSQDMVNRIVAALATADSYFDPTDAFAEQLGRAMDTARIVFSTPITRTARRRRRSRTRLRRPRVVVHRPHERGQPHPRGR